MLPAAPERRLRAQWLPVWQIATSHLCANDRPQSQPIHQRASRPPAEGVRRMSRARLTSQEPWTRRHTSKHAGRSESARCRPGIRSPTTAFHGTNRAERVRGDPDRSAETIGPSFGADSAQRSSLQASSAREQCVVMSARPAKAGQASRRTSDAPRRHRRAGTLSGRAQLRPRLERDRDPWRRPQRRGECSVNASTRRRATDRECDRAGAPSVETVDRARSDDADSVLEADAFVGALAQNLAGAAGPDEPGLVAGRRPVS